MIKINNINGSPESIPSTKFGSNFDGEFWYFFESEQEKKDYYDSLPTQVIEPTIDFPLTDEQLAYAFQRLKQLGIIP